MREYFLERIYGEYQSYKASVLEENSGAKEIHYNQNREISGLVISNQNSQVVYSLSPAEVDKTQSITVFSSVKKAVDYEQSINRELERTGVALDTVLKRYKVQSIQEMSEETCQKAINSLKKTKSKAA